MEVHHHPQVEKKNFKEYVFEFIMIFLAVTLGFIAENVREGIGNSSMEKEYMRGMLQDMAADTAMLDSEAEFSVRIGKGLDSLSKALYTADGSDSSTLQIYRLNVTYRRMISVEFNDVTAIELRNSGGMKLIKNSAVRSAIANYWQLATVIHDGIVERYNNNSDDLHYAIFNGSNEHVLGVEDSTGMTIVRIDPHAHFMTNDKNLLINYANRIKRSVLILNVFLVPNLRRQKQLANDLSALIKKEYNWENE